MTNLQYLSLVMLSDPPAIDHFPPMLTTLRLKVSGLFKITLGELSCLQTLSVMTWSFDEEEDTTLESLPSSLTSIDFDCRTSMNIGIGNILPMANLTTLKLNMRASPNHPYYASLSTLSQLQTLTMRKLIIEREEAKPGQGRPTFYALPPRLTHLTVSPDENFYTQDLLLLPKSLTYLSACIDSGPWDLELFQGKIPHFSRASVRQCILDCYLPHFSLNNFNVEVYF